MSRTRIVVNFEEGSHYDVCLGEQIMDSLGEDLSTLIEGRVAVILSDEVVADLYAMRVEESLRSKGFKVHQIIVGQGEPAKSPETAFRVWEQLGELNISRDAVIVAVGGGVVGDIAGFIASTYMRGVAYVQVPTTLLAMVDSSVGGKTAINLPKGKNLIGTFKQPIYVGASTDSLATLPKDEWACGCAEIAKSALVDSDEFFFWLSEHARELVARDEAVVTEAITRAVVFKANVVAQDEYELQGIRECLNYGHTLGHALETLLGYGALTHGEAVAIGMRFSARLAQETIGTSRELVLEQDNLLDALELPARSFNLDASEVLATMMRDKKVRSGELRFVLLRDIGQWEVVSLSLQLVRSQLEKFLTGDF